MAHSLKLKLNPMWRFLRRWTTCWLWHSYAPQIVWGTDQWGDLDFELEDFCWHCGKPRFEDVRLNDSEV